MKFFIDTADVDEIKELNDWGIVDGVTTNPSLIYKSGKDFKKTISEISNIVDGPVSAEVTSLEYKEMVEQGLELASISSNVVIKVPLNKDGLRACKELSSKEIKVNVTLCFSASQAILAAKMGAAFISPFIGRLDDISSLGLKLIEEIVQIYKNYSSELKTKVLVASIRSPLQVSQSATMGAHVATIPPKILRQMIEHPLTDKGIQLFMQDWAKTGQKF